MVCVAFGVCPRTVEERYRKVSFSDLKQIDASEFNTELEADSVNQLSRTLTALPQSLGARR